jgi:outer membrane lipoprotein LolB
MRILVVALLAALLPACVSDRLNDQPVTERSHELWEFRQQQLSQLESWAIRGRIALFVEDKVYNLGMSWQRQQQHSDITLEAALGQGVLQIQQSPEQVLLTTSEGKQYQGADAEQVLYETTGWSIPIQGLKHWILGIQHPGSSFDPDIDALGRVKSLKQDNWTINYLDYKANSNVLDVAVDLPRRIYMKRYDIALKIVIDQWQDEGSTPEQPDLFPDFSSS